MGCCYVMQRIYDLHPCSCARLCLLMFMDAVSQAAQPDFVLACCCCNSFVVARDLAAPSSTSTQAGFISS